MIRQLWARARKSLRSNAAIYLAGALLSRVGSIFLIPLYTRRLTPSDYGEYSLALSLLQLLPMCASLGLTAGITRVFFENSDRTVGEYKLGAVARGMLVIATSLLAIVALSIQFFVDRELFGISKAHLLLVVLASVGTVSSLVPALYYRAVQRSVPAVILQFFSFALSAGLGVLFVLGLNRGLRGAMEASAYSLSAIGAFGFYFVMYRLPSRDVVGETRQALGFSIAFVPHFLASWCQLAADRWVLTAFGASAELGRYYLAIQLLSPVLMIIAAWNDAEVAKHGEIYRDRGAVGAYEVLPKLYRQYFLVGLVPTLCLILGSPLIGFVIGPRFVGALAIVPFMGVCYTIDSLYYPACNYVFYAGRARAIPLVTGLSAVTGIGLSIFLLPRFGIVGLLASRICASVLRSSIMMAAAWMGRPHVALAPTAE